MFAIVIAWLSFGLCSPDEWRIERRVTRGASIEVCRYFLSFEFTLLVLDIWSVVLAVRWALILMLMKIPQKLELIEDKIRYCATCQSRLIRAHL